jgi:hypothetical protein
VVKDTKIGADMYQGFNDMIDGGGANASGQSFEGGGLLSMIANMIAKPRGSQQGQPEPMGGLLSPQARPAMLTQSQNVNTSQPQYPNTPPLGTMQPMQYSGRGNLGMPQQPQGPTQNPHPQMYQPMTFEDFVMGLGPVATTTSPDVLREAYRMHMEGYGQ